MGSQQARELAEGPAALDGVKKSAKGCFFPYVFMLFLFLRYKAGDQTCNNIISGTAGGRKFQKRKHIEPIEMERFWFDVTHLFEELLLAFD